MGIRFRKSISFGKFFRLNLSKSGVSLGVGPRGLNVNIGPRGVRQTIGLPGTGIYYQESHQWPKSTVLPPTSTATSPEVRNSELGWKIIGGVLVVITMIAYFGTASPTTAEKQQVGHKPYVPYKPMMPCAPLITNPLYHLRR